MNEFDLIKKLSTGAADDHVIVGSGDDCAVLQGREGFYQLATTDCLVEGVHFNSSFSSIEIGQKALAVNMSDIAAMGGFPQWALVSYGIPQFYDQNKVILIQQGISLLAESNHIQIVGGNITKTPHDFWISITLMGEVKKENCLLRAGAREGDLVYICGPVGWASLGLEILKHAPARRDPWVKAQTNPEALLRQGQLLADSQCLSSMIDVSDGLVADLEHLANASGVGLVIDADHLKINADYLAECAKHKVDPLVLMLSGGEDYTLAFTVKKECVENFEQFNRKLLLQCVCIGRVVKGKDVEVVSQGRVIKMETKGFLHF